jgi:DNA-directed RNA polymerase specialized sigma24 family protein
MALSAPEPVISFEQYLDRMRPWVDRIVRRRAYAHDVCLDAEDLRQDALLVLWTVHQRLAGTKPATDLCRIGTTAVVRKLITLYHQRRGKYRGTISLEAIRER